MHLIFSLQNRCAEILLLCAQQIKLSLFVEMGTYTHTHIESTVIADVDAVTIVVATTTVDYIKVKIFYCAIVSISH